ncbi:uncharacterized protein LOC118435995 [Folsomia candida]|uniref:uncharacterized protein LOC118435995 n=1 Tax=Folsomia candida TaxID=158441 RepID=UPI001604F848|nr:uncharacterized protein LOC118435995 [Folsomia candida]
MSKQSKKSPMDNESEINQDQDCGESSEDKQRVEELLNAYRRLRAKYAKLVADQERLLQDNKKLNKEIKEIQLSFHKDMDGFRDRMEIHRNRITEFHKTFKPLADRLGSLRTVRGGFDSLQNY